MTLPLLIGHCGYSESLNLIASARLCFSRSIIVRYDGARASPASTKKIITGSGIDWSPFVFSETDPGGLFTIVLFFYFVGVKHTKVTKQANVT